MTLSFPPQRRQTSMSMAKTRLRRWAQVSARCRSVANGSLDFTALPAAATGADECRCRGWIRFGPDRASHGTWESGRHGIDPLWEICGVCRELLCTVLQTATGAARPSTIKTTGYDRAVPFVMRGSAVRIRPPAPVQISRNGSLGFSFDAIVVKR
jgi:hypothetical protein